MCRLECNSSISKDGVRIRVDNSKQLECLTQTVTVCHQDAQQPLSCQYSLWGIVSGLALNTLLVEEPHLIVSSSYWNPPLFKCPLRENSHVVFTHIGRINIPSSVFSRVLVSLVPQWTPRSQAGLKSLSRARSH